MGKEMGDLLHGTLDLLILRTLQFGPLHGWAISKRIRALSKDVLEVNQGSLYPALYRLEGRGLLESEWGTSAEDRRVKLYSLTSEGRGRFVEERSVWRDFSSAVERVLGPVAPEAG